MKKQAISITLDRHSKEFVDTLAEREAVPRSVVFNDIIRAYEKEWLRREFQEGYASQGPEDVAMAEEGMEDYLKIIERDEK